MFQNIQAVIFDLDGTLLNTLDDLRNSVNAALKMHGLPERTMDEVRRFLGNGLSELVRRAIGKPDQALHDAVLQDTRRLYKMKCRECTVPYEGIPELLQTLRDRGMRIAVVSNKPDAEVKTLCKAFFGDVIDAAIGQLSGVPLKPAPDSVLRAMQELHVSAENSIYIGDSDVDILTAKHAGLPCISVLWGFRDKSFLENAGAACFAQRPEEINRLI